MPKRIVKRGNQASRRDNSKHGKGEKKRRRNSGNAVEATPSFIESTQGMPSIPDVQKIDEIIEVMDNEMNDPLTSKIIIRER